MQVTLFCPFRACALTLFCLTLSHIQATLFGPCDGEGVSIVFIFRLPDDFNAATFPNQKALALYKRFLTNGKEADGAYTRDRWDG